MASEWQRIEPLNDTETTYDLTSTAELVSAWRTARAKLIKTSPESLRAFQERLLRGLSIETGILEQLYDVDRGTTEQLIAVGFVEELVMRGSASIEPTRLIDVLRDHLDAAKLVMDWVGRSRNLTKGAIHELHQLLTRHQESTVAVDQFGERIDIQLRRGTYKTQPNNPRRPDGEMHFYCPPVHVESEMDSLLGWLAEYADRDPILVAAWLHHRFSQIHPYQDGNGRVSRALVLYVLLRADLLPIVIDRAARADYIGCLEQADAGDLGPLVEMFAGIERQTIVRALSIEADAEAVAPVAATQRVIGAIAAKLEQRRADREQSLRTVNNVAVQLRGKARDQIKLAFEQLASAVQLTHRVMNVHLEEFGADNGNSHWYRKQLVRQAHKSGNFINFDAERYFVKANTRLADERLVLVIDFHHIGRQLSGVMEAVAFAQLESYEPGATQTDDREDLDCTLEPFFISGSALSESVAAEFSRWLDGCIAIALNEFANRL